MSYIEQLKILVLDVDGTLTDGKVYMGDSGELFKSFNIKDGYALKEILPKLGIIPVVITARNSNILANRCKELDIVEFHQGIRNKFQKLQEILLNLSQINNCNYTLKNVIYIGDDDLDLQCMMPIKSAGGLVVCPIDGSKKVVELASIVSTKKGGEGVVRELTDWLLSTSHKDSNFEEIKKISLEAYKFILNFNPSIDLDGCYDLNNNVYANVMTYVTKNIMNTRYESHRNYIDIQYLIYGSEIMMVESVENIDNSNIKNYDKEKDIVYYNHNYGDLSILKPGNVIILKPQDAHRGAIAQDVPITLRKIVIKVPV